MAQPNPGRRTGTDRQHAFPSYVDRHGRRPAEMERVAVAPRLLCLVDPAARTTVASEEASTKPVTELRFTQSGATILQEDRLRL
jgi:hypothetical protein